MPPKNPFIDQLQKQTGALREEVTEASLRKELPKESSVSLDREEKRRVEENIREIKETRSLLETAGYDAKVPENIEKLIGIKSRGIGLAREIPSPTEMVKDTAKAATSGALGLLYNFGRPASALFNVVEEAIKDSLTTKINPEALEKKFGASSPLQAQVQYASKLFDAAKKGFTYEEEGTPAQVINAVMGDEKWFDKIDEKYKQLVDAGFYITSKKSRDFLKEKAIDKTAEVLGVESQQGKDWIKNISMLTPDILDFIEADDDGSAKALTKYFAREIATPSNVLDFVGSWYLDPVNKIPVGSIPAVVKETWSQASKASYAAAAKYLPESAINKLDDLINKGADRAAQIRAKVDPKYGAVKILEETAEAGNIPIGSQQLELGGIKLFDAAEQQGSLPQGLAKAVEARKPSELVQDIQAKVQLSGTQAKESLQIPKELQKYLAKDPSAAKKLAKRALARAGDILGIEPSTWVGQKVFHRPDFTEVARDVRSALIEADDLSRPAMEDLLGKEVATKLFDNLKNDLNLDESVKQAVAQAKNKAFDFPKTVIDEVPKDVNVETYLKDRYISSVKDLFTGNVDSVKKTIGGALKDRYKIAVEDNMLKYRQDKAAYKSIQKDLQTKEAADLSQLKQRKTKIAKEIKKEYTQKIQAIKADFARGLSQTKEEAVSRLDYLKNKKAEYQQYLKVNAGNIGKEDLSTIKGSLDKIDREVNAAKLSGKISPLKTKNELLKSEQALKAELAKKLKTSVKEAEFKFKLETGYNKLAFETPTMKFHEQNFLRNQKKIKKDYNASLSKLDETAGSLKFLDTYNNMLAANAQVFEDISKQAAGKLSDDGKRLYGIFRDVLDSSGRESVRVREVANEIGETASAINFVLPNYFPRKGLKGGMFEPTFEDASEMARSWATGGGSSKSNVERKLASYDDFVLALKEKGRDPDKDLLATVYKSVLDTKLEQARIWSLSKLPENLRKDSYARRYVDFLFRKGEFGSKSQSPFVKLINSEVYSNYDYANKFYLTQLSPTYHFRNIAGQIFLTGNQTGLAKSASQYPDSIATRLSPDEALIKRTVNGQDHSISKKEFVEQMRKLGLTQTSLSGSVDRGLKDIVDSRTSTIGKIFGSALKFSQEADDFARFHTALTAWKEGKNWDDIRNMVKAANYDMTDLNLLDKAIQPLFSFYTFQRKNLIGTAKGLINDPAGYATLNRWVNFLSKGEKLEQEDIDLMNTFDKDKIQIVKDVTEGVLDTVKLGFLPIEDWQKTAKGILSLDAEGFIEANYGNVAPAVKALLKFATIKAGENISGVDIEQRDVPIPEQYNSPTIVNAINSISKEYYGGPVNIKSKIRYENGERVVKPKVYIDPNLYSLLFEIVPARIPGELLQIYDAFREKEGREANLADLLSKSPYKTKSAALIKYFTGIYGSRIDKDDAINRQIEQEKYRLKDLATQKDILGEITYVKDKDLKREVREKERRERLRGNQ